MWRRPKRLRLWAFDLERPGQAGRHPGPAPHGGRLVCGLGGYQRLDSLKVMESGAIAVATLVTGCITVVAPTGEIVRQVPTGHPHTTNICFGGPDRRTAWATLSGSGELVTMRWPDPGLALAYEA